MLRGLYPEDYFKMTTKYGIKVYSSNNPELTAYIEKIISQLKSKKKKRKLHIMLFSTNLTNFFFFFVF